MTELDAISAALQRRQALSESDQTTDAWRLVDGEGDGMPGIFIDSFAGHWLVQTRDTPFPDWLKSAVTLGWKSLWWKRLNQQEKGSPELVSGELLPHFSVRENGVSYEIDFTAGYSQGLFLDQRQQRRRLAEWCVRFARRGQTARVLNLFAYTCAFSVCAAGAGAATESIDLSRAWLEWGKRNFGLNGLDPAGHFFCRGDSFDWLRRLANKGRLYDFIVLDPPTFSRNDDGKVWRVEKDYPALVAAALKVLAPEGRLLCCTNHHGLASGVFLELLDKGAAAGGRPIRHLEQGSQPGDFSGETYLKAVWLQF